MSGLCQSCGAEMVPMIFSSFCPNDCDRRPSTNPVTVGPSQAHLDVDIEAGTDIAAALARHLWKTKYSSMELRDEFYKDGIERISDEMDRQLREKFDPYAPAEERIRHLIASYRRVPATLIANEIIGVQPMPADAGQIFYMDHRYESRRPDADVSLVYAPAEVARALAAGQDVHRGVSMGCSVDVDRSVSDDIGYVQRKVLSATQIPPRILGIEERDPLRERRIDSMLRPRMCSTGWGSDRGPLFTWDWLR